MPDIRSGDGDKGLAGFALDRLRANGYGSAQLSFDAIRVAAWSSIGDAGPEASRRAQLVT